MEHHYSQSSAYRISVAKRDTIARRLFSCPACGAHWVMFDADGAHIVGVREASAPDPATTAVACEYCLTPIDIDGNVVIASGPAD